MPLQRGTLERTLVVIKPDALRRGLAGRIIARLEAKGLAIAAARLLRLDRDKAERFYAPHRGKPFYEPLVEFMLSGPVMALVLEGKRAVAVVRSLIGATDAAGASPGTIRGDWALSNRYNLVHASDSEEAYHREISALLSPDDIIKGVIPGTFISFDGET